MAYQPYSNPRASAYIATDETPIVQYRRSSRRFSEIKIKEISTSSVNLLDSMKPASNEEDDDSDFVEVEEHYSPEGVWGWVIVFGAFCTNFVVDGISLSYGVMTEGLTSSNTSSTTNSSADSETSNISNSTMTLTQYNTVGSILLGVTLIMGPFSSVIAEKFGFRLTAMAGSVIATVGILSSWLLSPDQPQFWAFTIGFGVLTGIGFGILFTVSVVIVGLYFSKNRTLATGITVAGTGVGTLVMAQVMSIVMEMFQWQGAVIFQAILCASSFFFGALYREIPTRVVKKRRIDVQRQGPKNSLPQQLLELLTSPSYWLTCVAGSLVMMGYFAPFGFLVDSAAEHIGKVSAVNLLSILGVANAVGRVAFGFLANSIGHSLHISNIALTVGGLVTALYPFATTHVWLIVCAIVFGLYSAVFASLRSIVIMNIVGEEKFNVAFGLSLLFMGIATFFSNSFGGYLKDTTENFDMSFYAAGAFLLLSAVICYPLPCILSWEQRKNAAYAAPEEKVKQQRKSLVDVHVDSYASSTNTDKRSL